MRPRTGVLGLVLVATTCVVPTQASAAQKVIIDTDIGTDIDDAFAVALSLRCPELDILGFSSASGDTLARARIIDRILDEMHRQEIPVAVGKPTVLPFSLPGIGLQGRFGESAETRSHPQAIEFIAAQIRRFPDEITLITLGPLTNVGGLLDLHPDLARKLKRVIVIGGWFGPVDFEDMTRGPTPEYNIVGDIGAAKKLIGSGLTIDVISLDATVTLRLDEVRRHRLFTSGTKLSDALTVLYHMWGGQTPILFDTMAIVYAFDPSVCPMQAVHMVIDDNGLTRVVPGATNVHLCLTSTPQSMLDIDMQRLAP